MELELLEQLLFSDDLEPLHLAWLVFAVENNPANLERARHAILMQIRKGFLQVLSKDDSGERVLESWEAKQFLSKDENWLASSNPKYFLRVMDKGAKCVT